jgi:hypothetical protein
MEAVSGSGAILITGPANAKTELIKHIHQHGPTITFTGRRTSSSTSAGSRSI